MAQQTPLDFSSQAVPVGTWQPPATDKIVGPAPKPLDFSKDAIPWTPPASDAIAQQPAAPEPLDFSKDAVPWTPPPGDAIIGQAQDLSAYGSLRPTSNSPIDALRNSAGSIVSGIGKLGGEIDSAINAHGPIWMTGGNQGPSAADQAVVNAGQAISGPNQYQPAPVHQLGHDLSSGKPLTALNDAAGVVAGVVPYAATAIIPGVGAAVLGGSAAGNTIAAREAAKGESAPSLGDAAAGAADGVLNAAGGGLAHGVLSPAAKALLGPAASGILSRTALSAVTGGGLGAANNVASTAGTGNLTGSGVLSSAVEGAGAGGLTAGALGPVPAIRAAMQERNINAQHPEYAASVERLSTDALNRVQAATAAGGKLSVSQALDSIGGQLDGEMSGLVTRLSQSGAITQSDKQSVIQPLLAQAKAGTLHPSDAAVPGTALSQLSTLQLSPDDAALLRNGAIDLSTLARNGSSSTGLLRPIVESALNHTGLRTGADIAGALLGFSHGGDVGGILGGAAGVMLPQALSVAAGGADRLLGANVPAIIRQRSAAAQALQRAGMSPSSALAALQAARQAAANTGAPTPEQVGAAQALKNQQAMLARLGGDHPVGAAALASLIGAGQSDAAQQALAQYAAMASVRDAQAAGTAHDAAARHQANLDAAEQTPGGPFGLDAINAAANELGRKAQATQRLAGNAPGDSQTASGVGQAASGPGVATGQSVASSESPGPSTGGLKGLGDWLTEQAIWRGGVGLAPEDIRTGLDNAAAAGALTPPQYEALSSHLVSNAPLHHTGGAASSALEAVLTHAIAAKTGAAPNAVNLSAASRPAAPTAYTTQVRDTVKYGQAATSNRAAYTNAFNVANSEGRPDLARAAMHAMTTSSAGDRQAIFAALSPDDRARAGQLLPPRLRGADK